MKVSQIHNEKKQSLSFEIFPPKKEEDFKNIDEMLGILCECNPEYISVTFGAGGSSNNNKTIEIAKKIKNEYHVEPVVHLTCLCYDKNEIDDFLTSYYEKHTGIYLNSKKFIDDLKKVNIYT